MIMKNSVLHKADTRGSADLGWLKAKHTFSFSNYYNPERMNFGVLRVLNDDIVAGGMGFGKHPHENMEIITIPLAGALEHRDSMGNSAVIQHGDIQVMSAGRGIQHSEFNANKDIEVKLLQIWLLPNKQNVMPRYDQITLNINDRHNQLQQILSPYPDGKGVWIHQNAWFHLTKFDAQKTMEYDFKKKGNGLYVFVISGSVRVGTQLLNERDGFGVWNINKINLMAETDTEFLLMEIPMSL